MSDLHVPKLETFDIGAQANVDPKGFVRAVDVFEVHPHGLYMARGADHPQFGYLESWLLPSLGLRANIFHFRPGVTATSHRYLDVAEVTWSDGDVPDHPTARGATADVMPDAASAPVWRTRDLYLDLLVLDGAVHVDDADAGAWAIDHAFDALAGITAHDGDVDSWLAAAGCPVTWSNDVTLAEANQPHPKRVPIGQGPDTPAVGPTR